MQTKKSVEEAMAKVLEKAKAFTEAHQGEDIDEILAEMRGEQILANSAQTCKIENYQEEGWYSSGDDEYIYGISFDEPIKLPVEFYYKKKEANNEQERTEDIR